MSFQKNDLSVLAYANGFTLWHYKTVDATTTILSVGYFNEAASMIKPGDFIFSNMNLLEIPAAGFFMISENTGSTVSISSIAGF